MGIDLWLKTRFVLQSPPILKVKVLNFKSIKVICFVVKNPDFLVKQIRNSGLKSLNNSPGRNFGAEGTKFG